MNPLTQARQHFAGFTRNGDEQMPADHEQQNTEWHFAAFGLNISADSGDNGFTLHPDGTVSVWSLNNRGKLNLPSTDGLAFYYTAVPADKDFSLQARVQIDSWTFTNGQEGFGLMAADRVGRHGEEGSFWNNVYMAVCGRIEYRLDPETGTVVTDRAYPLISMKLGIGALEKTGVTPENLSALQSGDHRVLREDYSSAAVPLELSCAEKGGGSYNLFANETGGQVIGTVEEPLREVILRLRKTASGYEISYLDPTGAVIGTKRFYNPGALAVLDPEHVYVGFFAARFCHVTFRDIRLRVTETTEPTTAHVPEIQKVVPTCRILSSGTSNHAVYYLRFVTNADGQVSLSGRGTNNVTIPVHAGRTALQRVLLQLGENPLHLRFEPQPDFCQRSDAGLLMVVNRPLERTFTVSLQPPEKPKILYVCPNGTASGTGTKDSPVDIFTAIRSVLPGSEIILLGGVYHPGRPIQIDRDVSGVPGKPIHLHAEAGQRAVFDFEQKSAGFIVAGSYWEIDGIECRHSAPFTHGIVLCGHDICLHHSRAVSNSEGGIVIWALEDTDSRDEWPHDIQVVSCISTNNADPGMTNADGFAAKLRVGPGIVFDRCISCYNADDGWDLFEKVELGPTGPVVIKNCISFGNGFDPSGRRRGYGNGFKLGGTSLPGGNFLYNCAAWGNAGKGIDSNTTPDGHIRACTSAHNLGPNVALYTSDATHTNYTVHGVISCRRNRGVSDVLKPRGSQPTEELYGRENFYWSSGKSTNADGLCFDPSWFVSMKAPHPSPGVPDRLMDANGNISLGYFLRLNETARAVLTENGLDPDHLAAQLHGQNNKEKERTRMNREVIVNGRADIDRVVQMIQQTLGDSDGGVCQLLCETMLIVFLHTGLTDIRVNVAGRRNPHVNIRATGNEVDLVIPEGVSEADHEELEIGLNILESRMSQIELTYRKGINCCRIYTTPRWKMNPAEEIEAFYRGEGADRADHPMAVLVYLIRHHRGRFFLGLVSKTIRHIGAMMLPVCAAGIIDAVTGGHAFFSGPVFLNIMGSVLALFANLFGFWAETITYRRFARAVESGFRMALVRKLQLLSMRYHSTMESGKLLSKLISDVQFVHMLITDRLQDVLHLVIDIIIMICVALLRYPPMLLFYLLIIPATILLTRSFAKPVMNRKVAMRRKTEDANASFRGMLGMDQLTRMHGLQKAEYEKISGRVRRVQAASNAFDDISVAVNNVTYGGFQGFRLVCLCFAAFLFTRGQISVGLLFLFQSIFDMMINSIQKVLDAVPQFTQGYDSLASISEILTAKDVEHNGTVKLPLPVQGEIELDHVTFRYEAESTPVLRDVSLMIPAGSVVAFVGESGSGKSTLLNLILGLYSCTEGEIRIDGFSLEELDKNDFRRHVAVVPQNTVLFSGTLWDNLVYGLRYVSRSRVMDVIRSVGLDDLIESLPDGLDSQVLEDGSNLSGGQRQRIAIARAMLRNARIILFDEATSALDARSEEQVQKAIDAMMSRCTVIMVAHRLNTLRKADRIYRIEDGKAVLYSSFDQLIRESNDAVLHE